MWAKRGVPKPVAAVLTIAISALVLGCGGGNDSPSAATEPTTADAKTRAGRLLDEWSGTLVPALLAARERGEAAVSDDRKAYDRADRELRPLLRDVKRFAPQGRMVMSRYPASDVTHVVVADGDAWQEWALSILRPGAISLEQARDIADLGTAAFVAHEKAYSAAGREPPPAFQRRADQT